MTSADTGTDARPDADYTPGHPHAVTVTAGTASAPPQAPETILDGSQRPAESSHPANDTTATAVPTPEGAPASSWLLPLLVLVAGMFMSVLDISIINVAIPTMQNDFGAPTDQMAWVSTSYTVAEGVVVPISAWLGVRLGFGRVYIASMIGFAVGSILCGLAWDLHSMVAFRIIQAIPGGIIPVVALSMLYKIVPSAKIGVAMGIYGLGVVVAPALGPTLGGYLVEYVDWRLIFFINVPIAILGVVAALIWLPRFAKARTQPFDLPGFTLAATAAASILLAVSEGHNWGWTSYPTIILATVGALALALFVVIELEVDHPMLDVRAFTNLVFTNSLLLIGIVMIGLFGVLFYIPIYLQQYQGLGAFHTGLLLLPQAIAMAIAMPLAGQLYDRLGARWPASIGLAIAAAGTWMLVDLGIDTAWGDLSWILTLRSIGLGLAMMPIMTCGLSALPDELNSYGSAFNTMIQRVAAAIGLGGMTALITLQQSQAYADRTGLMPNPAAATELSTVTGQLATFQNYRMVEAHAFVTALDDLMLTLTVLTALAVPFALMLPSGRPAATDGPRVLEG